MGYLQGLVNLIETSPSSGGNVVLPGSHHKWKDTVDRYYDARGFINYRKMAREQPEMFAGSIRAHLHAGDLFCWDSRTLHANTCGRGTRQWNSDEPQLLRIACFVCMAPRAHLTDPTIL